MTHTRTQPIIVKDLIIFQMFSTTCMSPSPQNTFLSQSCHFNTQDWSLNIAFCIAQFWSSRVVLNMLLRIVLAKAPSRSDLVDVQNTGVNWIQKIRLHKLPFRDQVFISSGWAIHLILSQVILSSLFCRFPTA